MRTIIAGSREGPTAADLQAALAGCGWRPSVVLSGTARGADSLGEYWALTNGVPIESFPADWNRFGKRAGYLRNTHMAQRAQALIALWDGQSRGTKHMIDEAARHGLRVWIQWVAR